MKILEALRIAVNEDRWVEISFANEDGTTSTRTARIFNVAAGSVFAVQKAGSRFDVPVKRIVSVTVGSTVVVHDRR